MGDIALLENYEVIKYLKEALAWKPVVADIEKKELELRKLTILYPFDDVKKQELDTKLTTMKKKVEETVGALEKEDAQRKLYTMSKSQSKDSVQYPIFRGKENEDVHSFIKEFKDCLLRNQVPEKDEVKVLRTYLRDFPLDLVHKELIKVEEAFKILIKQFGGIDQI